MQAVEHYVKEFSRVRGGLPDAVARDVALADLQRLGFPLPRHESWRDTNLGALFDTDFGAAQKPDAKTIAAAAARLQQMPELLPDAVSLVLVNGWYVSSLSNAGDLPEGVVIKPGAALPVSADSAFSLLSAVFSGEGLQLVVRGAVAMPLHLIHIHVGQDAPLLSCPRFAIVFESGSSANIVESGLATAGSDAGFSNFMVQLDMAADSNVTYSAMQWDAKPCNQLQLLQVRQQSGSRLLAVAATAGADCARRQTNVELCGEQATCELRGLYLLGAKRQMDFRTKVVHASARSESNQLVLGLVRDRARAMFCGHLVIDRDAQQVEAHQKNENLILSDRAFAGSQPMLEIHADDVKCSHGASVGDMDRAALFYLRARGLDQAEAERVLADAFINRVLEAVPYQLFQSCMREHLTIAADKP